MVEANKAPLLDPGQSRLRRHPTPAGRAVWNLVFDVELLGMTKAPPAPARAGPT